MTNPDIKKEWIAKKLWEVGQDGNGIYIFTGVTMVIFILVAVLIFI